jgi:hypothetical protein
VVVAAPSLTTPGLRACSSWASRSAWKTVRESAKRQTGRRAIKKRTNLSLSVGSLSLFEGSLLSGDLLLELVVL